MSYYAGDIIQLGPNHRLVVEQDDYPGCPRGDWHMLTGAVNVRSGYMEYTDIPEVYEEPIPIAEAHERLFGLGSDMRVRSYVSRETSVIRWAKVFHGLALEYDQQYSAYWFCDLIGKDGFTANWPDLVPGTPEHLAKQHEVIAQEREVYRQWADGEVYGVRLDVRIGYQGADTLDIEVEHVIGHECEADCPEHWDSTEAIWGSYLTDDYTPVMVAKEYFDLAGAQLPE